MTDEAGVTFIPASRRPDGSWRKEVKVRAGYLPPEEVAAYKPKAVREVAARATGLPIGMDPDAKPVVVRGRGAPAGGASGGDDAESAAARKNARRREKRAEERKAAEEAKLVERLASVALSSK